MTFPIASFPLHDWQFYVATILALISVAVVARPLLPRRPKKPGCTGCASPKPK